MEPEILQKLIRDLPEIAAWPDLAAYVDRPIPFTGVSAWDYPMIGCSAVGGAVELALPAAAAVVCALVSIRLVDDILDDDPQGHYRCVGAGRAANMALALQAAGHQMIERSSSSVATRAEAHHLLSKMTLRTALGQDLDSQAVETEEQYWRSAEAKSCPMFAMGLSLGALLGGASAKVVSGLAEVGAHLGKLIQISDDMFDAMSVPARTDWQRPRNNLAILFALEVQHAGSERLRDLIAQVASSEALREAQNVLVRSGAISYCIFKLVETANAARAALQDLVLSNPEPVHQLIEANIEPARRVLAKVGLGLPPDLTPAS